MKKHMNKIDLNYLFHEKYIDELGLVFGQFIQRYAAQDPWAPLAAALVSRAVYEGHVCLDVAKTATAGISSLDGWNTLPLDISPEEWFARLDACSAVGRPGEYKPLILNRPLLYLHRFWHYESELAKALWQRLGRPAGLKIDPHLVNTHLSRLFMEEEREQREAARLVLSQRFCIISGGPGTGKTYTVAKLIVLLTGLNQTAPIRIKLTAPTGKAAARLQETLIDAVGRLAPGDPKPLAVAAEAQTIHRLLAIVPNKVLPGYNSERPLPADIVIADEASMIDLELMIKLINALTPETHLVLTGDKDQLASVEAGAVLGDICHLLTMEKILRPTAYGADSGAGAIEAHRHIALLNKSYRFAGGGAIARLSRAINAGDTDGVMRLLTSGERREASLKAAGSKKEIAQELEREILEAYGNLRDAKDPWQALVQLKRFRILSPVRQGPFGVEEINRLALRVLKHEGAIDIPPSSPQWYIGRPILVTRNDYFHRIFNGDTGIAVAPESGQGAPQIAFEKGSGEIQRLAPHELPPHETVYASTVHKSQGSEFDRVVLVLPDRDNPILTREMIYTAVTRARQSVAIFGDPQLLAKAISRRTERVSGLRERLISTS
jgi:exodeoxyribonuclease V alpha subunit